MLSRIPVVYVSLVSAFINDVLLRFFCFRKSSKPQPWQYTQDSHNNNVSYSFIPPPPPPTHTHTFVSNHLVKFFVKKTCSLKKKMRVLVMTGIRFLQSKQSMFQLLIKPVHEISNNVVCATSKASDQPAHTRSLIRAFASRLSIL